MILHPVHPLEYKRPPGRTVSSDAIELLLTIVLELLHLSAVLPYHPSDQEQGGLCRSLHRSSRTIAWNVPYPRGRDVVNRLVTLARHSRRPSRTGIAEGSVAFTRLIHPRLVVFEWEIARVGTPPIFSCSPCLGGFRTWLDPERADSNLSIEPSPLQRKNTSLPAVYNRLRPSERNQWLPSC